jgi:hypothetical protein
MLRPRLLSLILLVVLLGPTALADDVRGANRLLCTVIEATSCHDAEDCITDLPSAFNIPQFIEVDLTRKLLSTTQASLEPRQSPIGSITRGDGLVVIQGLEQGRAFSFIVNEQSGRLSAAVARDGITVTAFGACTPK